MEPETASKIASGAITKGDVLAVARVAGIQAAKQTPNLLPLCHPLLVGSVYVNFRIEDDHVEVEAQVDTVDRTGVEMEALTACADRRADDLRHVQVDRPGDDDRRSRARGRRPAAAPAPTAGPRADARRPRPLSDRRAGYGVPHGRLDASGLTSLGSPGPPNGRNGAGSPRRETAGYIRCTGGTTGAFALTIVVILVLGILAGSRCSCRRSCGRVVAQSRTDSVGDFHHAAFARARPTATAIGRERTERVVDATSAVRSAAVHGTG